MGLLSNMKIVNSTNRKSKTTSVQKLNKTVDPILLNAELGPSEYRKDAPHFSWRNMTEISIALEIYMGNQVIFGGKISYSGSKTHQWYQIFDVSEAFEI